MGKRGWKGGRKEGWKERLERRKVGRLIIVWERGAEGWKEGRVGGKIGKEEGWKVDKYGKEG